MHFTQQSRMPCFFYVTNSVYMEQKPETGKSTDKTKNACYTSTIKANFINAIQCAKEGKYDEAAELIKQGDEAFSLGHNAHADLLTMDANGEISNGYMLLMHAEDQLMSAEGFRILADEFIALYKRIDEK